MELKTAYAELKEIELFKEGMTSMIVHDLKNPLNVIINTPDNYSKDEKLEIHQQYGRQMLIMVLNILDVNKYEKALMTLDLQPVSLLQISINAVAQIQILANNKKISIGNNIPPTIAVLADAEILERVFVNLLTNAIKYSTIGEGIVIDANLHSVANPQGFENLAGLGFAKVTITDSGKGIPQDKRHKVFQKFGQVEAKNSGGVRSTGIGLTFCKLAIEAHGGEIDFDSIEGKGTTFWFTLQMIQNMETSPIIDVTKQIQKVEIQLNETEKAFLSKTINELKKYEIYQVSLLLEIINQIEDKTEQIKLWRIELTKIIYKLDEEEFRKMINS